MTTKHRPSAMPKWCGKVPARNSDSSTSGIAPTAGPHGAARAAEQGRDQHLEGPGVVEGDAGIDIGVAQRQHRADQRHHRGREREANTLTRVVLTPVWRATVSSSPMARSAKPSRMRLTYQLPTMVISATASSVSIDR